MADSRFISVWSFLKTSYDDNAADVGSDMKCAICTGILINAHAANCGCRYCLDCVKTYLNGERRPCPGDMEDCRLETLDIDSNVHPDLAVNYKISKLIVACRHSCGFRCEVRNMEEHERACGKPQTDCPFVSVGCTATQLVCDRVREHIVGEGESHARLLMACIGELQGEMSSVKRESGELRAQMAEMSSARGLDEALARRASEKVDQVEQEVANLRNENKLAMEENRFLKSELERDREKCRALEAATGRQISELLNRVQTQTRLIERLQEKCSCNEIKLDELDRRGREDKENLYQNIESLWEQQGSAHELEKRVQEIGATVEVQSRMEFIWRIDGWAAKCQSAKEGRCMEISSPPFVSHKNGYRMCLSVWPNGHADDKGRNLTVFVQLMPGRFDNILSWPFKRDVTLSIINQRTNRDHANCIITFAQFPNHANWNKPANDKNGPFSTGLVELASLTSATGLCQDNAIFVKCVLKNATIQ